MDLSSFNADIRQTLNKYEQFFRMYDNIKDTFPLETNSGAVFWYTYYLLLKSLKENLGGNHELYKDYLKTYKKFLGHFRDKEEERMELLNEVEEKYGANHKNLLLKHLALRK